MKKLLCLSLIIAMILPVSSASAKRVTDPSEGICGPILTIRVELGRRKKDCTGFGICHVSLDFTWNNPPENEPLIVVGNAWVDGGKLHVEFTRAAINANTYDTYFKNGEFRMEEDFVLPDDVAAALGVSSYTIKTGNYQIGQPGEGGKTLPVSF